MTFVLMTMFVFQVDLSIAEKLALFVQLMLCSTVIVFVIIIVIIVIIMMIIIFRAAGHWER